MAVMAPEAMAVPGSGGWAGLVQGSTSVSGR
jgi:hypothetical protein